MSASGGGGGEVRFAVCLVRTAGGEDLAHWEVR